MNRIRLREERPARLGSALARLCWPLLFLALAAISPGNRGLLTNPSQRIRSSISMGSTGKTVPAAMEPTATLARHRR